METVTTEDFGPVTVKIHLDPEPMSPREWDNLGLMLCAHRRYNLGDEQLDPRNFAGREELLEYIRETYDPTVILPLYLLDHSGISMRVGDAGNPFWEDPGNWDSGQVGFIIDTADNREKMGTPAEHIEECLRAEVEAYNRYLMGMIYGFTVEDEDGEILDACWGIDDDDYALSEARAIAEVEVERINSERKAAFVDEVEHSATYAWNGAEVAL